MDDLGPFLEAPSGTQYKGLRRVNKFFYRPGHLLYSAAVVENVLHGGHRAFSIFDSRDQAHRGR